MGKDQYLPDKDEWAAGVNRSPDDLETDDGTMAADERSAWFEASALSPDDIEAEKEDVRDVRGDMVGPMTDDQARRLKGLCWRLGVSFDPSLTSWAAERRIAELERRM